MELVSYWYKIDGQKFSPRATEQRSDIVFTDKYEVGDENIRRGKPTGSFYDFGLALLTSAGAVTYSDLFSETDTLLNAIERNIDAIRECGADDIVAYCTFEYEGQCNLEFSPDKLRRLADLSITLAVSCYKGE
jgi:hypothetical protein